LLWAERVLDAKSLDEIWGALSIAGGNVAPDRIGNPVRMVLCLGRHWIINET